MKTKGNKIVEGSVTATNFIGNGSLLTNLPTIAESSSLIQGDNWFNPDLIEIGQSVNGDNGNLVANGSFDSSGKQAVLPNTRYYIAEGEFPTAISIPLDGVRAYYDVNGDFIDWKNLPLEADNSFITPANVYFIQWSLNSGNFTEFTQIRQAVNNVDPIVLDGAKYTPSGDVFNPSLVNVKDAELRKILYPLEGKKWLTLGDSISQQNLYAPYLKRTTGLIQFENLGVSGRQISQQGVLQGLTQEMITEADVITCLAGINDYGLGSQPLGTIADDSSVDTFYGDMRGVLETIYNFIDTSPLTDTEKMKKLVCFATPNMILAHNFVPPAAGAGGKTLLQIRNAIKDVCAEFGTPVFDNYTLSGINQINMIGDGLHPAGQQSTYGLSWGKFLNANYKGI